MNGIEWAIFACYRANLLDSLTECSDSVANLVKRDSPARAVVVTCPRAGFCVDESFAHSDNDVAGGEGRDMRGALELGERPFARCLHQAIDDWTVETDFSEPLANGCQILAESENFCDAV